MSLIVDGTTGVTFNDSSLQGAAASPFGLKNRIINGDMVISQRGTSAVTVNSGSAYIYGLDRWAGFGKTSAGVFTMQQSSTAPANFTNSVVLTVTTSATPTGTDAYIFRQAIEGFNLQDIAWGTANAQTVTLSFWVRSSLTGTFSGVVFSNADNSTYPFTYTISAANTWEKETITIPGPTSGSFSTGSNAYLNVVPIVLGAGTKTTPNAWNTSATLGSTGATDVISTNGATFFVTGVQLERNTTATPFEWLPYGTELALCQRYYQTLPFDAGFISVGATIGTGSVRGPLFKLNQNMRVAPTVTLPATGSAAGQLHYTNSSGSVPATIGTNGVLGVQVNSFRVEGDGYNSAFTAGQAVMLRVGTGAGASITATAEL